MSIDPEGRIVSKETAVALELKEGPNSAGSNSLEIAHSDQYAIRQTPCEAGHIDHDDKPAAREAVVADARIAGEVIRGRRRQHRMEEDVRVCFDASILHARTFVKTADAAIDRDDELAGASRTHGVWWERIFCFGQCRAQEICGEDLRRFGGGSRTGARNRVSRDIRRIGV